MKWKLFERRYTTLLKRNSQKAVSSGLVHKDQCNCGPRRTSSFHSWQQILSLLAIWCWFLSACKVSICVGSCGSRELQKSNSVRQGWNPINTPQDATEWGCKNETQIAIETPWCCRCQLHVVPTEEICRLKMELVQKTGCLCYREEKMERRECPNPLKPCQSHHDCVVVNLMQVSVVWKEELSIENMSP